MGQTPNKPPDRRDQMATQTLTAEILDTLARKAFLEGLAGKRCEEGCESIFAAEIMAGFHMDPNVYSARQWKRVIAAVRRGLREAEQTQTWTRQLAALRS